MTENLGFQYEDFFVQADYGSVQEALQTYGFIYGRNAIKHLLAHNISSIQWKLRMHYKWKGEA